MRVARAGGERGLSLFDLLVTMTLVAMIGAIAAPAVHRYVEAARLRAAGWALVSDLHRTRQKAIAENRSHRLTLSASDLDPGSGDALSYSIAPTATGTPEEHRDLPAGIRSQSSPGTWVEFNSRGLAVGASELRLQTQTSATVTVRVRSTGHVDLPG